MTAAQELAAIVVMRRLTNGPMTSRRRVKRTSGTRAKGIPNDRTTCERTRLSVAGSRRRRDDKRGQHGDAAWRRKSGRLRLRKPLMTTWPAYVPTLEDETPEASSATAKTRARAAAVAVEVGVGEQDGVGAAAEAGGVQK